MCPWNLWKVEQYPLKAPLPPVFLACAADDKISINFSDPLTARLKELHVPVLYWRVPGGGHSAFHRPSVAGKWMEKLRALAEAAGGLRSDRNVLAFREYL